MKKQNIRVEIPYSFSWSYGAPMEQVKKDIEALEKLGADEICIESEDYYGSISISFKAYVTRLETLVEARKRIEEENYRKQTQRERDLATLKQLKELYPDK